MSDFRPADPCHSGVHSKTRVVRTLGAIVAHSRCGDAVRKSDLQFGDRVIVTTRNSVYTLCTLGGDSFAVSGGWFDRNGEAPTTVTVAGCTYGGRMIRQDVVAARGLFMEFGNRVSTTRIRRVRVVRWQTTDAGGQAALPC